MVNGSATSNMAANYTLFDTSLPPLPEYTLTPQQDLLPWISDAWLNIFAPVVIYWVVSMIFHVVDVLDLFPQYRLHTPDEILRRNHVSRYEVARDVIIQQIIQIVMGALLAFTEPPEMTGKADYDVAVWATRLRLVQRALPGLLGLVGVNATTLSKNMASSHPFLAGALAGGYYPFLTTESEVPAFAPWEMASAKFIYNILIPGLQFFLAVFILDTWQYFLHRLMHMNKWLYSTLKLLLSLLLYPLTNPSGQQPSTRATTVSTCRTPMAPSTTTPLRASSSIALVLASVSNFRE